MKLRALSPMLENWEGSGKVGTDLDAAPDGSPVLILDGQGPVKPEEAAMFELEIMEASADERQALTDAGFQLKG